MEEKYNYSNENSHEYIVEHTFDRIATALEGLVKIADHMNVELVRHGHWEYHTRYQRSCVASCSICKKRTTFFFKNGTKYCPFCGAKMDGEE